MIDARRDVVAIGAGAEEEGDLAGDHVAARHAGELPLDRQLRRVIGKAADAVGEPRRLRHVAEKVVDRCNADRTEHLLAVGIGQGQIAHLLLRHPSGGWGPF